MGKRRNKESTNQKQRADPVTAAEKKFDKATARRPQRSNSKNLASKKWHAENKSTGDYSLKSFETKNLESVKAWRDGETVVTANEVHERRQSLEKLKAEEVASTGSKLVEKINHEARQRQILMRRANFRPSTGLIGHLIESWNLTCAMEIDRNWNYERDLRDAKAEEYAKQLEEYLVDAPDPTKPDTKGLTSLEVTVIKNRDAFLGRVIVVEGTAFFVGYASLNPQWGRLIKLEMLPEDERKSIEVTVYEDEENISVQTRYLLPPFESSNFGIPMGGVMPWKRFACVSGPLRFYIDSEGRRVIRIDSFSGTMQFLRSSGVHRYKHKTPEEVAKTNGEGDGAGKDTTKSPRKKRKRAANSNGVKHEKELQWYVSSVIAESDDVIGAVEVIKEEAISQSRGMSH